MDLHQAARKGNGKAIRQLLEEGADVNLRDERGRTPLILAAKNGKAQAVKLLLDLGADASLTDPKGRNALAYALDSIDDAQVFCRLIEKGCDPNTRGAEADLSALERALHAEDLAAVEWLIAHGADVHLGAGSSNGPPLYTACMSGGVHVWTFDADQEEKPEKDPGDAAQKLRNVLDKADKLMEGDLSGFLEEAEAETAPEGTGDENSRLRLVRRLLAAGADPNGATDEGITPLMIAAQSGDRDIVTELLRAGADVNRVASTGGTALHRAVGMSVNAVIVQDLLEAGADPNLPNPEDGRTVLMEVVHNWPEEDEPEEDEHLLGRAFRTLGRLQGMDAPETLQLLIRAGADVDAQDSRGETALAQAVQGSCTAAVEALLEAGADPYLEDEDGRTAFDHLEDDTPARLRELVDAARTRPRNVSPKKALMDAIAAGDAAQVREALAAGADPNPKKAPTPLIMAAAAGNRDVVLALLRAGAEVNPAEDKSEYPRSALIAAAEAGHVDVLRLLLESGADPARGDQCRDALLSAVYTRHWEAVELLLAAAPSDPELAPFLEIRQFAVRAAQPEFQRCVQRLAERIGSEGVKMEELPGIVRFALPKTETPAETDSKDFLAEFQETQRRKEQHKEIVVQWSDSVRSDGYHLVVGSGFAGESEILLVPSANQYAILAALGTNGMNYDLTTIDVIRWLRKMEQEAPFVIDGVGHDKVEGRFLNPVADVKSMAKKMYKFCPDIVDQGCGTVKRLAAELERTHRFFFWWD